MIEGGYFKGELCGRYGCQGIIDEYEDDRGCQCPNGHPPCSYCVDSRAYCEECGWDGKDEQRGIEFRPMIYSIFN